MKQKLLLGLAMVIIVLGGCVAAEENSASNVPLQAYNSDNGFTVDIPEIWVKGEETQAQVEFSDVDNQVAFSITTELGGVDYYSPEEIMGQLTDEIATELFSDYEIAEDSGDNATYLRILEGANADGAHLVTVLYINQPYQTIRHYLVFIASGQAYAQNATLIKQIITSFTTMLDEDQYLQLMTARRAAEQAAQTDDQTTDDSLTEDEQQ
jgi:hypothetical protein